MTYFVCDRFGFVSEFFWGEDYDGAKQLKAKHCVDVREAMPFESFEAAERAYAKMGTDWYRCVVNTDNR